MNKPKEGEIRKPIRSLSGIVPVAVMLPPRPCDKGTCIYCPSMNAPQSYTPKSPAVLRAKEFNYDSFKQTKARIKSFEFMRHNTSKIELIIMGGTFLQYDKKFQYEFVKGCYDALNGKRSKDLKEAQKKNETAEHRCIALCIETRPDCCEEYIDRMREFGATRVELGVQLIDDEVYKRIRRNHTVQDVINATKALRNAGFKIGYHLMPGLPGSNIKKDLKLFKKLFSDENFKPDQLKIYPCMVMPHSDLEKEFYEGKYEPYSKKTVEKLLILMFKKVPRYCRVMRVMREIPPEFIVAGIINIDLRGEIEKEWRNKKIKLKEIRYREIGFARRDNKKINLNLRLRETKYKASGGLEYFLEFVNKDDLIFGLLRLRIFEGKAIVRELHVYGKAMKLQEEKREAVQHHGLGKKLMKKAEEITFRKGIKKLSIISGIGVREYYKKIGYHLEGTYMVKILA